MITKEQYESALKTVEEYEHGVKCSRCKNRIDTDRKFTWESDAMYANIVLGVSSVAHKKLWKGDALKYGLEHPAIGHGSGYQKVNINIGTSYPYKLCWDCHSEFVGMIGDFLKSEKKQIDECIVNFKSGETS